MPKRVQRKRTRGWRMPAGAVYVGRGSKWGNPHTVADCGSHFEAVARYVHAFSDDLDQWAWLGETCRELKGRDLACWCPLDSPCHADVLLTLANNPEAIRDEVAVYLRTEARS